MARKKNSKQKLSEKLKVGSISKKLFPVVKTVTAPISFLEQLTSFDRASAGNNFSQAGYGTQLKMMSNMVLGRLAGITPFNKVGGKAPQTINPSGVLNKWTNAGLIGIGYQIIGRNINKAVGTSIIPETARIGSIAKSAFVGGALGGFFSQPTQQTFSNPVQSNSSMVVNGNYNSGQDSTLGSN